MEDEQRNKVLRMLEEKEKQRQEKIREIKSSSRPDWEKKMMLKAARSSTYGWDARKSMKRASPFNVKINSRMFG